MKIYTRSGDDGTTGLYRGGRLRKDDGRIECYGTVDELNAAIGLAAVGADDALSGKLQRVQNELFAVGALLATPDAKAQAALPQVAESCVTALEEEIDAADAAPLQTFILPGGTETAARLHLARAVCRRAERRLVTLHAAAPQPPVLLRYLNRLADWLFTMARLANRRAGAGDVPWRKPGWDGPDR